MSQPFLHMEGRQEIINRRNRKAPECLEVIIIVPD